MESTPKRTTCRRICLPLKRAAQYLPGWLCRTCLRVKQALPSPRHFQWRAKAVQGMCKHPAARHCNSPCITMHALALFRALFRCSDLPLLMGCQLLIFWLVHRDCSWPLQRQGAGQDRGNEPKPEAAFGAVCGGDMARGRHSGALSRFRRCVSEGQPPVQEHSVAR